MQLLNQVVVVQLALALPAGICHGQTRPEPDEAHPKSLPLVPPAQPVSLTSLRSGMFVRMSDPNGTVLGKDADFAGRLALELEQGGRVRVGLHTLSHLHEGGFLVAGQPRDGRLVYWSKYGDCVIDTAPLHQLSRARELRLGDLDDEGVGRNRFITHKGTAAPAVSEPHGHALRSSGNTG